MIVPGMQVIAQVFTERLLNTAIEGLLLVGLVWVLLRLIGRQNSGTRFAIWISALLSIVALPFLSGSGLGGSYRVLPENLHWGIVLSGSWAFYLFALWGIGAGLSLFKLGVGLWRVREIRRKCSDVDLTGLNPTIAGVLRDFGSARRVKLCVSADVTAPAAIGFFTPAIVIPAGLMSQLAMEELKVILLHELAHLGRWDDWTNLGQKIVKAVFFFHPAVWWIESRLTLEREMACDDIVLAQTSSPRAYAASLISFAEKLENARSLALAQALVSRMCQMSQRVANILDARRPGRNGLWKPVAGVSVGLVALVAGAAPYAPRVVAFESQPRVRQMKLVPPTLASSNAEVPPSAMNHLVSAPSAPSPRIIATSFHPRTAVAPVPMKKLKGAAPAQPLVTQVRTERESLPMHETFLILQTTQDDASGSSIWTLSVWRVGDGDAAARDLQSAIVLSLI